jgi:Transposase and inactivated derivatives
MITKTNKVNKNETTLCAKAQIVREAELAVKVIRLGIDLHKKNAVIAVQLGESPPQPAQRVASERVGWWVGKLQARHPNAKIHFIYEAGPCGYWLYRALVAQGCEGHVCAPVLLNAKRKNDKRDARAMVVQLRDYMNGDKKAFGKVHVPEPEHEEQRALARHRRALLKSCGQFLKRCKSAALLHGRDLAGKWWKGEKWEEKLPAGLPGQTLRNIKGNREVVLAIVAQIEECNRQLEELAGRLKVGAPYGIGRLTALMLHLEMGDWNRFTGRRAVGSYTGLCPGEHSSGGRRVELSIDKQGNSVVRHLLILAAWRMERYQPGYPPIRKFLSKAEGSRTRRRAIVAVARHLAIDLWRLATGKCDAEKLGLRMD